MNKKRMLHIVTAVAFAVFIFVGLASSLSTPAVVANEVTENAGVVLSSETTSYGQVNKLPPPVDRPFSTLGLVFAVSETKYDENGNEISGQEGITTMLLREAKKIDGDDILNLRTDENVTYTKYTETREVKTSTGGTTQKKVEVVLKTVTVTGSALAIKYLNIDADRYGKWSAPGIPNENRD